MARLGVTTKPEEEEKKDPKDPEVNQWGRRKDKRNCEWGTNSNKNAAVISRKLNGYLTNTYPSEDEVKASNKLPSSAP